MKFANNFSACWSMASLGFHEICQHLLCGELVCIRAGERLGLDHPAKDLGDGSGLLELHHGGSTVHLFLDDANGTLEDVNGLNQILLLGLECGLLLGADLGGCLQVRLIGGDGACELLDLGFLHLDVRRLLLWWP